MTALQFRDDDGLRGSRQPVRRERFNTAVRANDATFRSVKGVPLPLTQTQLASAVADRAEIPRAEGPASCVAV